MERPIVEIAKEQEHLLFLYTRNPQAGRAALWVVAQAAWNRGEAQAAQDAVRLLIQLAAKDGVPPTEIAEYGVLLCRTLEPAEGLELLDALIPGLGPDYETLLLRARLLRRLGRLAEAVEALAALCEANEPVRSPELHFELLDVAKALGQDELWRTAAMWERRDGLAPEHVTTLAKRYGRLLQAERRYAELAWVLDELLAVRTRYFGEDDPVTRTTRRNRDRARALRES